MPDTPTPRLGLVRPLPAENYDVSIMNGNSDKIDAAPANAKVCTSGTRPGSPDVGDLIWETDTSRVYIWSGSGWDRMTGLTGGEIAIGYQLNYGQSGAGAPISIRTSAGTQQVFSVRQGTDTANRLYIDSTGKLDWGSGSSTADVNLYRSAVNILRSDFDISARSFRENGGAVTVNAQQNTAGTTTSTTYVETLTSGTPCSFTFVAPRSGIVKVFNNCWVDNTVATVRSYCSFIIRTGSTIGSGTTVLDGDDEKALIVLGTADSRFGSMTYVTGFAAGATYNIRQRFKVDGAGTGSFLNKELTVEPVLF